MVIMRHTPTHKLRLYMSIHNVTCIWSYYDNYYVICMYYEAFFSYRPATRSSTQILMSICHCLLCR